MNDNAWHEEKPVSTIIDRLQDKAVELHRKSVSNSVWTVEFKNVLKEIGHENGYTVWGNNLDNSEWLFDVCWVKDGDKWQTHFKGLAMACEMEWGESDFEHLDDFYKLTVCNAGFRLFLFGYPNNQVVYREKINLFKHASSYTRDQKYLAIGVPCPCDIDLPWDAWIT